jgi:hypothetical protein
MTRPTASTLDDVLVVRGSAEGKILWQHSYGNTDDEDGSGIAVLADGTVAIAWSGDPSQTPWLAGLGADGGLRWKRHEVDPGQIALSPTTTGADGLVAVWEANLLRLEADGSFERGVYGDPSAPTYRAVVADKSGYTLAGSRNGKAMVRRLDWGGESNCEGCPEDCSVPGPCVSGVCGTDKGCGQSPIGNPCVPDDPAEPCQIAGTCAEGICQNDAAQTRLFSSPLLGTNLQTPVAALQRPKGDFVIATTDAVEPFPQLHLHKLKAGGTDPVDQVQPLADPGERVVAALATADNGVVVATHVVEASGASHKPSFYRMDEDLYMVAGLADTKDPSTVVALVERPTADGWVLVLKETEPNTTRLLPVSRSEGPGARVDPEAVSPYPWAQALPTRIPVAAATLPDGRLAVALRLDSAIPGAPRAGLLLVGPDLKGVTWRAYPKGHPEGLVAIGKKIVLPMATAEGHRALWLDSEGYPEAFGFGASGPPRGFFAVEDRYLLADLASGGADVSDSYGPVYSGFPDAGRVGPVTPSGLLAVTKSNQGDLVVDRLDPWFHTSCASAGACANTSIGTCDGVDCTAPSCDPIDECVAQTSDLSKPCGADPSACSLGAVCDAGGCGTAPDRVFAKQLPGGLTSFDLTRVVACKDGGFAVLAAPKPPNDQGLFLVRTDARGEWQWESEITSFTSAPGEDPEIAELPHGGFLALSREPGSGVKLLETDWQGGTIRSATVPVNPTLGPTLGTLTPKALLAHREGALVLVTRDSPQDSPTPRAYVLGLKADWTLTEHPVGNPTDPQIAGAMALATDKRLAVATFELGGARLHCVALANGSCPTTGWPLLLGAGNELRGLAAAGGVVFGLLQVNEGFQVVRTTLEDGASPVIATAIAGEGRAIVASGGDLAVITSPAGAPLSSALWHFTSDLTLEGGVAVQVNNAGIDVRAAARTRDGWGGWILSGASGWLLRTDEKGGTVCP